MKRKVLDLRVLFKLVLYCSLNAVLCPNLYLALPFWNCTEAGFPLIPIIWTLHLYRYVFLKCTYMRGILILRQKILCGWQKIVSIPIFSDQNLAIEKVTPLISRGFKSKQRKNGVFWVRPKRNFAPSGNPAPKRKTPCVIFNTIQSSIYYKKVLGQEFPTNSDVR